MNTAEFIKQGRKDIKLAFQSERRLYAVAEKDHMNQYEGLREHYFNTGRTIIQLSQQVTRRLNHDN